MRRLSSASGPAWRQQSYKVQGQPASSLWNASCRPNRTDRQHCLYSSRRYFAEQQALDSAPIVRISQRGSLPGDKALVFSLRQEIEGIQSLQVSASAAASTRWSRWLSPAQVRYVFEKVYLPVGYPDAVRNNYRQFVSVMMMQIFFSNMSRILATQAMLMAVGVGSKMALPVAAVTAWVLKDGLGHVGAIAWGTLVNTRFDCDPKRYRFQATVLGKAADVLSILTLHRPEYFLLLSTIGSALGRIGTSTAASCRPKIYETFALTNNLGDVLRCAQSQSTSSQLLGIAVGSAWVPMFGAGVPHLLFGNIMFSAAAMYAAYLSCSLVSMATFNFQRAEIVFQHSIEQLLRVEKDREIVGDEDKYIHIDVLTIDEVRQREKFVMPYTSLFLGPRLVVNPSIEDGLHRDRFVLTPVTSAPQPSLSLVGVDLTKGSSSLDEVSAVLLWYTEQATPREVIHGYFRVCVFRTLIHSLFEKASNRGASDVSEGSVKHDVATAYHDAEAMTERWWPTVSVALLTHGWRFDVTFLDDKERRVKLH